MHTKTTVPFSVSTKQLFKYELEFKIEIKEIKNVMMTNLLGLMVGNHGNSLFGEHHLENETPLNPWKALLIPMQIKYLD